MIINIYEIYISAFPTIYYLNNLRCLSFLYINLCISHGSMFRKKKENVN